MSQKKSNARQRMIEAGLDLFHRQGITATSVDEILERSGAGKSQFYYYFKSKDGLVHQVLLHFYNALQGGRTPSSIRIESWKELEDWFRAFVDYQRLSFCERSCPVGTIGNDLTQSQELLRQDVKLIFVFMRDVLARFFTAMKAKGELPKSADPENLADLCFVTQQGGLLLSKIERDCRPFERSVSQLLDFLRLLRTSD